MAPYGSLVQTTPLNLRFGAPGLLFDQEYGLARLRAGLHPGRAPACIRCGAPAASCGGRPSRSPLSSRALLATVGAFGIWWGGTVGAGPADRVGPAAVDAADRHGVSLGAGRIAAPRRAAPAAVDRRRHRDHARDRPGRPADQQRARRHVGAARFLVAALGTVVAGADASSASAGSSRGCTRCGGWRSPRGAALLLARIAHARAPASRRWSRSPRSAAR